METRLGRLCLVNNWKHVEELISVLPAPHRQVSGNVRNGNHDINQEANRGDKLAHCSGSSDSELTQLHGGRRRNNLNNSKERPTPLASITVSPASHPVATPTQRSYRSSYRKSGHYASTTSSGNSTSSRPVSAVSAVNGLTKKRNFGSAPSSSASSKENPASCNPGTTKRNLPIPIAKGDPGSRPNLSDSEKYSASGPRVRNTLSTISQTVPASPTNTPQMFASIRKPSLDATSTTADDGPGSYYLNDGEVALERDRAASKQSQCSNASEDNLVVESASSGTSSKQSSARGTSGTSGQNLGTSKPNFQRIGRPNSEPRLGRLVSGTIV